MADGPLFDVLPEVFQVATRTSPALAALLVAADDMQRPIRDLLDSVDLVIDPFRAPPALVPYLSTWVDLDWLTLAGTDASAPPGDGIPLHRQRDLIAISAELSARRGTAAGIATFLRIATGIDGWAIRSAPDDYRLIVVAPHEAESQIDMVRRIVAGIKPAHLTHDVQLAEPSAEVAPPEMTVTVESGETIEPTETIAPASHDGEAVA